MDPQSLESLRECKMNFLEILEVQTRDWGTEHYKHVIKMAANKAKLIIATASNYLLQLKEEMEDFKEILRKLNILMAEQVLEITSKGLFIDGENINEYDKDDLKSLKSDEFRFQNEEAETLHDRQTQIKLNLDIKSSIRQTRKILDEVKEGVMVNTVAVEKLEDFIQKWAEKLIEKEEANKPAERDDDGKEMDKDIEAVDDEDEEKETTNENDKKPNEMDQSTTVVENEDGNENSQTVDEEKHSGEKSADEQSTKVMENDDDNANSQNVDEEKHSGEKSADEQSTKAMENDDDNENSQNVDEEKHSSDKVTDEENDVNITEESQISKVDADTTDDQRLKVRSKTLTSIKTDKLDAIPESDDDETDQDEENTDELATEEHLVNEEHDLNEDREDADVTKENIGNDDKKDNTDDEEEDIEMLMMKEVEEQEIQEQDDPFPAQDWDTFIYHRPLNQSENQEQEIVCVIIAKREMLRQNYVTCTNTHNPSDLRACLKNKHEKLLSYFVTVRFVREPVGKNECFVFIPYYLPSAAFDHVIRVRAEEGQWVDLPPKDVSNLTSLPGVNFCGFAVQDQHSIGLIVIAKEKQTEYKVPDEGIVIEPPNDRNITILISPETFSGDTNVSFSTDEVPPERLRAYKKDYLEFKNVARIGARLHLLCETKTEDDLSVIFYDLMRKENETSEAENSINLPYPQKEALNRCWRQLVNNLEIDTLIPRMKEWGIQTKVNFGEGESIGVEFSLRQKIENEETVGDKARLLLKEIEQCSLEDFNSFIICLRESNQHHLARLLSDTIEKVKKEPKSASAVTKRGKPDTKILVQRDNDPWISPNLVIIPERPEDLVVVLPPGGTDYQVVVVKISRQTLKKDLRCIADVIVNDARESRTSLICRQHSTHPEKITIQCVPAEKADSRIRHLKDSGYTLGFGEDIQFGMCDGEILEITFDSNLGLVDIGEDGILRLHYFSYLDTAVCSGDLFLVDERAQSQEPIFSGDLYYNVGTIKQRPPRTGYFKVTLPKSAVPYVDRTPFRMLDVQVVALAKYIGYRLGMNGRESVLRFAESLVDDLDLRRRLYMKVRRVCRGKDDRARCEMFIINWARQRLKFENKAVLLLDALWFEPDIQADAKDFALVYSQSGILCDHYLLKMSEFIGEEWITLGRKLCIPDRDLNLLRIDYKDRPVRNFKLLDSFRFSKIAIEQGTSVIRFLLRACKSAGCTAGLITFIRYIAGIFKELTFMRPQSWMSMRSAVPSVEIT